MFGLNLFNKYFVALVASAILLAIATIGVFYVNNTRQVEAVASAPGVVGPSRQTIDLGSGYRLEMDDQNGHIVAPETISIPSAEKQTIELGGGYRLEMDSGSGKIVPPSFPSTNYKTIDLGAGYVLVMNGEGGRIVAPANPVNTLAQPAVTQKIDLSSGYWLVTTSDGWKIVHEGTK